MTEQALALTGTRKAAALLIALGTDSAAKLLRRLPPEAIDKIALELLRTPELDAPVRDQVLEETYLGLYSQSGVMAGGESYALELFEEAYGKERAQNLLERVSVAHQVNPFDFLQGADPVALRDLLAEEHPQTIAIVLAHLDPRTAGRVLSEFDPELQVEIARRIALTEQTTPEVLTVVERGLRSRMTSTVVEAMQVGGIKPLAHVLNQVDRTTERQILGALAERDAGLAEEVRRFMFVFEDIIQLDDRSMQRLISDLDQKDIALALRTANEQVRDRFFTNMSHRAAEMLREEMTLSAGVRLKNVEEAQTRIVEVIKRLEDQDQIIISREGGDDVLV